MIENKVSFGIFMLIENTIIMVLLLDLVRRVSIKLWHIRHPHLYWNAGMIFLAYLLFTVGDNLADFYTCYKNYLVSDSPIAFDTVAVRVFERSATLIAKILLWYYTVKGGFNLFKDK